MALTDEQITEIALRPKRTTTDEGTVEEHNPKDVLAVQAAAERLTIPDDAPWGIRLARTVPRGTVTPIG
jgi:phage FluMu protein gp41